MQYVNHIISLTKESPTEPFTLRYKTLNGINLIEQYLPDGKIWIDGMRYKNNQLMVPDESMFEILKTLLASIESYPWSWDLNGEKLDYYGFDLTVIGNRIRFSPTALKAVQDYLGYEPEQTLETIYSQPKFAHAPHLTKLSIELEKTSIISEFLIQLHSVNPVRLAAFIYESSLSGEGHPIEINLSELEVSQSNESLIVNLGKPIVVKRLTITLAQDNLSEIVSLSSQEEFENNLFVSHLLRKYARNIGDINAE